MGVVTALILLTLLLAPARVSAQTPPEWQRVYTFEDSLIEMNTFRVLNDDAGVFRVTFRWSFAEPVALSGRPGVRYKSRLEVFQFDCPGKRSRLREVTLLDARGEAIPPGRKDAAADWKAVSPGSMTEKLFAPACRLIESRLRQPDGEAREALEAEKASRFALAFARRLAETKDFAPLVKEFFAPDYLGGYLRDRGVNWLSPLDRDTAARATRADLQRFHTAVLNGAYLGASYVAGRSPAASGGGEALPPDVLRLVEGHPYAAVYGTAGAYDYLAEPVVGVERLRAYTDLLERIGGSLRRHASGAARSPGRRVNWETSEVGRPRTRVCAAECLGLPAGTKLFQVDVTVFQLHLAEINGELKVVAVGPHS